MILASPDPFHRSGPARGGHLSAELQRKTILGLVIWLSGGTELPAAPPGFHAAVASDAPLLHYRFNEASGAAINHGTLGPSFNANASGTPRRAVATATGDTGISFDGVDDFLESATVAPASLAGNPTFSAEALVFVPTTGTAALWAPFLHWGVSDGSQAEKTMKSVYFSFSNFDATRIFAGFYNGGVRTSNPVPLGQWHHIVWVRQGGNPANAGTTLYIDGTAAVLANDPALPSNSGIPAIVATAFRINRARDETRFFTGIVDELALYNRVLTAAEVQSHFAALGPPRLSITLTSPTQVQVSWFPSDPAYVLQESASMSLGSWVTLPSPGTNPVTLPVTPSTRFFRLHKP